MLGLPELTELVSQVEYRPGWKITVGDDLWEGLYLRIVAPVENSYSPGETQDLGITTYISPNDRRDAHCFDTFLAWRLARIESHEGREWLRRDGRAIFDPHADKPDEYEVM